MISGLKYLDRSQLARLEAALGDGYGASGGRPDGETEVGRPVSGVVEYRPTPTARSRPRSAGTTARTAVRRSWDRTGTSATTRVASRRRSILAVPTTRRANFRRSEKGELRDLRSVPRLPGGDGRHRRRAPVSSAAACGLEGHAPTYGLGSSPGVVVGEQALLEGSRTRLPRGESSGFKAFSHPPSPWTSSPKSRGCSFLDAEDRIPPPTFTVL